MNPRCLTGRGFMFRTEKTPFHFSEIVRERERFKGFFGFG